MSTDFTTKALRSRLAGLFAYPFGRILAIIFFEDPIAIGDFVKEAFPALKNNLFYSDRNEQNTCRDGGLVR
jgi:hypothetical protein